MKTYRIIVTDHNLDTLPYAVVKRRTSLISVCPGFVADNEEIITADQIVASEQKS